MDKTIAFPGYSALLPTLGAVLLIAAGEKAWFNRRILSSKLAVYIGLISYPLYLWHWSLLSFAHIVENETPTVWIRLGVIVLSVLLAWATYSLIEKRLRFRQHWAVATGLFITLAILGSIGYQVYWQAGYPERYPHAEHSLSWNMLWNHESSCTEKFGKEFDRYCKIYDLSKQPTVMLIGDSNANHFYPGLAKKYAQDNENLLNLGQGGCPPLYGVNVSMSEGDLHCDIITKKVFNLILETQAIKTVILSMMGNGYATGKRYVKGEDFIRIEDATNPARTKPLEILENAMRVTFRKLTASGKQVVFVISSPMLDFNPASCVDFRPWRITPAKIKTPCATPRKEIDERNGAYRAMVIKVTQEFPQVKVWDTARELCDEKYCWAMKDGKLLYRDEVHLNEAGSYWMAERFSQQLAARGKVIFCRIADFSCNRQIFCRHIDRRC